LNRFNKYIVGESYTKEAARLYPKSRDQAKKRNTDFDLVERAHESEKEQLKTPPEPAHAFTVTLESDNYTEEKYSLFENYQRIVHHEPPHQISKSGFKNFLCSSPLQSKQTFHRGERRLGSYHQCYRLDGQLIAIGVLDLLPECISAVYFMYHQSVHQYSFGKVGALREIALAKEEGYQWWYSGFYIHSCVKMRYKGDYAPQYMLDPESYDWDLLDDRLKKRLGEKKFVSLSRERTVGALIEEENPMNSRSVDASADPIVTDNTPDYSASDPDSDAPVPNASLPLFLRGMPGILTKTQLQRDVDLDHINLQIQGTEAETCDLVSWDTSSIDNPHSIKGIIAELVAAVGPELGRQMLVSFD
jgi:arginine-tRNA-protein transferase